MKNLELVAELNTHGQVGGVICIYRKKQSALRGGDLVVAALAGFALGLAYLGYKNLETAAEQRLQQEVIAQQAAAERARKQQSTCPNLPNYFNGQDRIERVACEVVKPVLEHFR